MFTHTFLWRLFCLWMFAWSSWVYNVEVYRWANANVEDSWQSWSHLAAYAQTIAHYDCLAETMFGDQGSQSSLTIPKWLTGGRLKEHSRNQISEPFNLELMQIFSDTLNIIEWLFFNFVLTKPSNSGGQLKIGLADASFVGLITEPLQPPCSKLQKPGWATTRLQP